MRLSNHYPLLECCAMAADAWLSSSGMRLCNVAAVAKNRRGWLEIAGRLVIDCIGWKAAIAEFRDNIVLCCLRGSASWFVAVVGPPDAQR